MAIAFALGINKKENCHPYMMNVVHKERQPVNEMNQRILEVNEKPTDIFDIPGHRIKQAKKDADHIHPLGPNDSLNMTQS